MDQDAFTFELVGYWTVLNVLKLDRDFKQTKVAEIDDKLAEIDPIKGIVLSDEKRKELTFEKSLHERDIGDIDGILARAEHAYKFAELESRWSQHMRENGITGKDEKKQFLRQVYIEENELESKKVKAQANI